jgi:predicted ABC-type ATPase
VFSDPAGDKLAFLEEARDAGYLTLLCYIGLASPEQSIERVAMRVSQQGHDVPDEKLRSRFSRSLGNLKAAIGRLRHILVYDNSDLRIPFRHVATLESGRLSYLQEPTPSWLRPLIF